MFGQILIKAIQVGEKVFHILAPVMDNLDEYEKLGLEIIKDAQLLKQQAAAVAQKPAEPAPEQPQEVKEDDKPAA